MQLHTEKSTPRQVAKPQTVNKNTQLIQFEFSRVTEVAILNVSYLSVK